MIAVHCLVRVTHLASLKTGISLELVQEFLTLIVHGHRVWDGFRSLVYGHRVREINVLHDWQFFT